MLITRKEMRYDSVAKCSIEVEIEEDDGQPSPEQETKMREKKNLAKINKDLLVPRDIVYLSGTRDNTSLTPDAA